MRSTRFFLLCIGAVLISTLTWAAQAPDGMAIARMISGAKPGKTVTLPAGTFSISPITIPTGVKVRGAGYGKTVLDARNSETGLTIPKGAKNVEVSDLTVRGAATSNVLVQQATNVTLRRIRCTAGLVGISMNDTQGGRIENAISDANNYGIVVSGGEKNVVVNCTMAGNTSLGLSLPSGQNMAAFNNIVSDSATAVYVGEQARELVLDHNLYLGFNIGQFHAQLPRKTLNNWQYLSGLDAHSVSIPVKYEDAAKGLYEVTGVLAWALDRPVTAGWGTAKLGGQAAPASDIDGVKRPAAPGLGAYETTIKAPRPADGTFTVPAGNGLTSAGVFDAQGKLLAYLFHCLPLTAGKYAFWLPTRNYKGRAIEAGNYEVRVLKAHLDWQYMGWIGNTETSDEPGTSAPVEKDALAFDNTGRLMVGRHLSEEHIAVRGYDGATGKSLWWFNGDGTIGLTVASDGLMYALRSDTSKELRLTRLDPATGKIMPWGNTDYGHFVFKAGTAYTGVTALGDHLYYTDEVGNAVRVGTLQAPEPIRSIEVKAPGSPAADEKTNVVWVISNGETLVAVSADGKVIAQSQQVPQPMALAARDGHLAVASKKTGKIHFFDASDPANLKPVSTLGRGDGPDGLVLPDRFLFQDGAMEVKLAFGPKGELAVGEREGRLLVFDHDGKLQWSSFGIWGSGSSPLKGFAGTPVLRLFHDVDRRRKGDVAARIFPSRRRARWLADR